MLKRNDDINNNDNRIKVAHVCRKTSGRSVFIYFFFPPFTHRKRTCCYILQNVTVYAQVRRLALMCVCILYYIKYVIYVSAWRADCREYDNIARTHGLGSNLTPQKNRYFFMELFFFFLKC